MRVLLLCSLVFIAVMQLDTALTGGLYTSKFVEMSSRIGTSFLR